ncbi:hypothetical protein [Cryobacterium sp. BB736]|uniref:hypothetical protein n=1 Tax=Cryobacterium sp. BB736 TaxID=2746963 RepID=UPI00187386DD|nr:hypothetical protein [Cryobacterium sp. BB736]
MGIEKIKWSMKGFRELRKSREVMSDLIKRGDRIESAAGPGYVASPFTGRTRGRVSVMTEDQAAREDNARNNTLIRSLDAGA